MARSSIVWIRSWSLKMDIPFSIVHADSMKIICFSVLFSLASPLPAQTACPSDGCAFARIRPSSVVCASGVYWKIWRSVSLTICMAPSISAEWIQSENANDNGMGHTRHSAALFNYSNLFPCEYSIWFVVFLGKSSINSIWHFVLCSVDACILLVDFVSLVLCCTLKTVRKRNEWAR